MQHFHGNRIGRVRGALAMVLRACGLLVLVGGLALAAQDALAQSQSPNWSSTSDLGRENLNRVAASAVEIAAVLHKDSGLIVELKRWVAKEATDHGQMVSDSDLTDSAIYERLRNEVEFRSIATRLLQRYGYLLPQINPDSPMGQEQKLLLEERTKWLAQDQEEERTRQREERMQETGRRCDIIHDPTCVERQGPTRQTTGPSNQPAGPQQTAPNPNLPPGNQNPQQYPASGERLEEARTLTPEIPSLAGPTQSLAGAPLPTGFPSTGSGTLGNYDPTARDLGGDQLDTLNISGQLPGVNPIDANASAVDGGPGGAGGHQNMPDLGPASSDNSRAPGADSYGTGAPGARLANTPYYLPGTASPLNPAYRPPTPEPPAMVRRANPYAEVPSLYDMYLQAQPHPTEPKRFGLEIFQNGTRDPQLLPMDLPVGPDYVVGPGDALAIDLWGGVSQRFYKIVDREGRIALPEVGPLLVSGRSLGDVQGSIQQLLRTQFHDISADVSLARLRTIRVYVVGDVQAPGAYDISSLSTPLNALFSAGGPTTGGSLRILKHYRGNQLLQEVDLYDLLLHGVRSGVQRLENGDTVLVPPMGAELTVEGMVRRPAVYELDGEKSLADAVALAGGMLPIATVSHIEVQRLVAHEKHTMLSLDIPDGDGAEQVKKQMESFRVQDGDKVRLFPIAPFNQDAVYLEGHVLRPGRYSYQAGMKLTDLVQSYADLLPEPASHYAEIVRLNEPDHRPVVESFDLGAVLANKVVAPVLHPMDTVQIFSKYDFENPPSVSVWGEVRKPGIYRTTGQIHLADAVHIAGGLSPEASTIDAQIFRLMPDGEMKILSVDLKEALAGNPVDNLLLDPLDRIIVQKNIAQVDPATVYVKGEVAKPGRYPLTANMGAADLIRVAGGLRRSADTSSADLTHIIETQGGVQNGKHLQVPLAAALAGDAGADVPLRNGDVLTVRQVTGWGDLGAAIAVKGEVAHPGTFGIRPGEKLSSVIERAGGFSAQAYPYGAILERTEVRELEEKSRAALIERVKEAQKDLKLQPDTDPDQKQAKDAAYHQWQATIDDLLTNPPIGRMSIHISSDINHWANAPADVEVRAGDTLIIPKRPDYVMIMGQVYDPTAISYRPGKSAKWYLGQAGGPTTAANKKAIFVIRADGSVVGSSTSLLWRGDSLGAVLQPGDTVVVPERALGVGFTWRDILLVAQVTASIASTAIVAAAYL